jgi:L-lactate dehydrogenase complex protein LldF
MGIVLTVLLKGMKSAYSLLDACTLCGACVEVCPVEVPLKGLIRGLRERRVHQGFTPGIEGVAMNAYAISTSVPTLFEIGQKLSRFYWPFLTGMGGHNSLNRLPKPSDTPLRRRIF